jgi:hypothetical protein
VVLAIAATVLCLPACGGDELDIRAVGWLDYGGRVERIETLGRYSSLEASLLVQLAGAPGTVATDHDYFLYRVIYSTTGIDGEPTRVSGLIAVPATPSIKGVVSWQHGTNTYRPNSISKPSSPEGLGIAALFAADGFILAAADYIGLGVSTEMHPYYHYPTTVGAVVDLLSIAEVMLDGLARAPDHDLYIAGFSEGGGATAATQRALERDNPTRLELRAAATVGAAFDPRGVSLRHVMQSDDAFHLGYLLTAFSRIYGQSLAGVVREPYADQLAGWYDGTKGQDYIDEHLPKRLDEFLTEAFLLDYAAGKESSREVRIRDPHDRGRRSEGASVDDHALSSSGGDVMARSSPARPSVRCNGLA